MKHLFLVHSHITFLVSKQYIFDKGIDTEDCMFLCSRDYEPTAEYKQKFKNLTHYPQDVFGRKKESLSLLKSVFNGFKEIRVLEDYVASFCKGDNFLFYPFSTCSHLCCILVTMESCKGYFIIEEGSFDYRDPEYVKRSIGRRELWLQSLLAPFLPRFYLLKDNHFSTASNKYLGTIATSEKAFPQIGGEHIVVSNPFDKKSLPCSPTAMISIDASLYLCEIDLKEVRKIMDYIYQFILQRHEIPIIAIKIHPMLVNGKVEGPFRDILSRTFKDVRLMELSGDISIEEVLNEYHCDFFSDWSSVAIYGNEMGCTCYSYAWKLMEISDNKKYRSMFNNMYGFLKNVYVQLP